MRLLKEEKKQETLAKVFLLYIFCYLKGSKSEKWSGNHINRIMYMLKQHTKCNQYCRGKEHRFQFS